MTFVMTECEKQEHLWDITVVRQESNIEVTAEEHSVFLDSVEKLTSQQKETGCMQERVREQDLYSEKGEMPYKCDVCNKEFLQNGHPAIHRLVHTVMQPPLQWVLEALSAGVKQLGCEANHSPLSSAEVKKTRSYTSTLPYVFIAWYLVKHRGFTLPS